MQSHMDGLRIMTQKLITDLWSEWRRASREPPGMAVDHMPAAEEYEEEFAE